MLYYGGGAVSRLVGIGSVTSHIGKRAHLRKKNKSLEQEVQLSPGYTVNIGGSSLSAALTYVR